MNRVRREVAAILGGPPVGREMDGDAAIHQSSRERFGREQMAAGAAGCDQDRSPVRSGRHTGLGASDISPARCACGRSRVSAISMPMP